MELDNQFFTFSSYNLGCLRDHYDYMINARMSILIGERLSLEPMEMALIETIQEVACRRFLSKDSVIRQNAERQWCEFGYEEKLEKLFLPPGSEGSIHQKWYERSQAMMSDFKTFPIEINDSRITEIVKKQAGGLGFDDILAERQRLYQKIVRDTLGTDILCFQEADYMPGDLLPFGYASIASNRGKMIQRIAWNTSRFELVQNIGDIAKEKGLVVILRDKTTAKTVAVAAAHLQGCNPFQRVFDLNGIPDSKKGDEQLLLVIQALDQTKADVQIIGMDANVTALHPRLKILLDKGYELDGEHFFETTCSSPYFICNTRLDWIAAKGASIINVPVKSVNLNSLCTNPSDHKPIAAKVHYAATECFSLAS